jgi:uncharacterized protein YraI
MFGLIGPDGREREQTDMRAFRNSIGIVAVVLLSGATALAEPAYVASTVNLRAAAGTTNEVVAKIPAGSLVDATNCSEWCEVKWRGKNGFTIASALDRSGRVPSAQPRRAAPRGRGYALGEYVPVGPPVAYGPAPYYYGYWSYLRPHLGPYWGYRRWYW